MGLTLSDDIALFGNIGLEFRIIPSAFFSFNFYFKSKLKKKKLNSFKRKTLMITVKR